MAAAPLRCDLLVIGSGASGLAAAVTAAHHGLKVVLVENDPVFGGATAWSVGWLWVPGNPLARRAGIHEDPQQPRSYLRHALGPRYDAERVALPRLVLIQFDDCQHRRGVSISRLCRIVMLRPVADCMSHSKPGAMLSMRLQQYSGSPLMRNTLFVMVAGAGLLSACGGGGGADSTPVTPVVGTATVALSGTAAKGLMVGADVDVFAVKADGSVDATSLGHTTTSTAGTYSLTFTGNKDQPYVVRVSANAVTTHQDEVTQTSQPLPAGFVMRSLVTPTAAGSVTTTASITPFSEMAVAAAAKAMGGLTAANAAQAVSAVSQLLGFDPTTVAARTVADATGANEQKLAVMLTAVSQLANTNGLGCSTGSGGDKTKCVVDALAAAASKDSIKLGSATNDVSAKLAAAVTTVLTSESVRAKVDAAVLTTVVANLGCVSSCAAAAAGTPPAAPSATATAIAAARLLFGQIKTDWAAMFSTGGASAIAGGALNKEAFKFKIVMEKAQVPADMLAKDVGAILTGIDLYNDFKSGRSTANFRDRGDASQVAKGAISGSDPSSPVGCSLYAANNATGPLATSAAAVGSIACTSRFYITSSGSGASFVRTTWRQSFVMVPDANGGYAYQGRARRSVTTCSAPPIVCSQTINENLLANAGNADPTFDGTVTPVLSAAFGDIQSFTLSGKLPPAFTLGGNTLVGAGNQVKMTGTQTVAAVGDVLSTLQGSLATLDSSGAVLSTLTVKPGSSLANSPVSVDAHGNEVAPGSASAVRTSGGHLSAMTLNLVYGLPSAEFEGVLSMTDAVWDKSGHSFAPTKASLSGALRNLGSAGSTEFLKGSFAATLTGYGAFDATQPSTSTNSFQLSASFVGSLTATNRPTLEFTLGTSTNATEIAASAVKQLTLQYRTLVAGVPRTVVSLTGDRLANGDYAVKLTEATSKLSLAWTGSPSTVDLLVNDSTKVGSLDAGSGLLTFVDGSFMSLDIGL